MAKDVIITPLDGDIQFKNASSVEAGRIEQINDDLAITNAVGDVLIGDGSSDLYIGDGVSSVDLVFDVNGSVRGETGVTLTLGASGSTTAIAGLSSSSEASAVMRNTTTGALSYRTLGSNAFNSTNYVTAVTAGSGLSGGGTGGSLTLSHSDTSTLSGTYGSTSDGTKIDSITVDAFGHVTAVATGAVGDILGVTAGSGLTGGGTSGTVTVSHSDTSSQGSVNNSSGTVIQDVTLDTYGHVTALGSVNLDGRYYTETEVNNLLAGKDNYGNWIIADDGTATTLQIGSGDTLNIVGGTGITSTLSGSTLTITATNNGDITGVTAGSGLSGGGTSGTVTLSHSDTSSQASVNNSSGTVIQDVTLDTYGHITALGSVNLDGRYYTETESDGRYLRSNANDTATGSIRLQNDLNYFGKATTNNEAEIVVNTGNAGSPQIGFTEHGDASWAIGIDDADNSFKIHGTANATIPTINSLVTPLFEVATSAGFAYLNGQRIFNQAYHPNADKLTTAREIILGGDLTGSAFFDGSSDITISAQVSNDSHTHDTRYLRLTGGTLTGNLTLTNSNGLYINDTNTRIDEGSGNAIRHQTNSGWIDVGPQNATWAHIYTDRNNFYFNKNLYVLGDRVVKTSDNIDALNDYEEGTFTPAYGHTSGNPSTVTYDTGNTYGKYTKIGNVVHCSGRIRTDAITWASTNYNTVLKGFPFTCSSPLSTGTGCVAGVIGFAGGFASTKPVTFQMRDGQTEALLYGESITSSEVRGQPNIKSGDFTTGTNADKNFITFQITYHTA